MKTITRLESGQRKEKQSIAVVQAQDAAGKATGSAKDVAGDVKVRNDCPSAICICALPNLILMHVLQKAVRIEFWRRHCTMMREVLNKHTVIGSNRNRNSALQGSAKSASGDVAGNLKSAAGDAQGKICRDLPVLSTKLAHLYLPNPFWV